MLTCSIRRNAKLASWVGRSFHVLPLGRSHCCEMNYSLWLGISSIYIPIGTEVLQAQAASNYDVVVRGSNDVVASAHHNDRNETHQSRRSAM